MVVKEIESSDKDYLVEVFQDSLGLTKELAEHQLSKITESSRVMGFLVSHKDSPVGAILWGESPKGAFTILFHLLPKIKLSAFLKAKAIRTLWEKSKDTLKGYPIFFVEAPAWVSENHFEKQGFKCKSRVYGGAF